MSNFLCVLQAQRATLSSSALRDFFSQKLEKFSEIENCQKLPIFGRVSN